MFDQGTIRLIGGIYWLFSPYRALQVAKHELPGKLNKVGVSSCFRAETDYRVDLFQALRDYPIVVDVPSSNSATEVLIPRFRWQRS
jgi:hypothetical protein